MNNKLHATQAACTHTESYCTHILHGEGCCNRLGSHSTLDRIQLRLDGCEPGLKVLHLSDGVQTEGNYLFTLQPRGAKAGITAHPPTWEFAAARASWDAAASASR
jgi:hypothetical protein